MLRMKRFVIGDIHGHVKALEQCLVRSGFDKKSDMLVSLGDVCDRGRHVRESIDMLLEIKNLVYVLGNHDLWLLNWALDHTIDDIWLLNGGSQTMRSYTNGVVPDSHIELLNNAPSYFLTGDNKLFVHAGINPGLPLQAQKEEELLWNREFALKALEATEDPYNENITSYDEVYIGHTPTNIWDFNSSVPLQLNEVWMMDTGVVLKNRLSIMDIDTKQYWQSDIVT